MTRVKAKWRPTLGAIIFSVLIAVMALPLVGLFFFRLYENQLIRQTESELIAQSAVLAAVFASEVAALPPGTIQLGQTVPPDPAPRDDRYRPIEPSLDLTDSSQLGRRADPQPSPVPPSPDYLRLGAQLETIALEAQKTTLAGYRLLDPSGIVIAGRAEVGQSLAHVEEVATALAGRYSSVLRTRVSDEPPPPLYSISRGTSIRVFTAMPVVVSGQVAGVIYASRTPGNIIKHIYDEQGKFILAGLTVLAVTLILALILSRVVTRPIHALVARSIEIGQGRRDALTPIAHHGTREIALLSQSFLDMAEKLAERSTYIATFAAHVSHELKSPLTSIQGAAELLRDDTDEAPEQGMTPAERRRFLDNMISDTRHLTALLSRLRELARADNPHRAGSTTLGAVASELRMRYPQLAISAEGERDIPFAMSKENALIVFGHLADNAARHGATALALSVEKRQGRLEALVQDDGSGITPGNRDKIFNAFFTTRRESGGTGMGLGIVAAMLRAHGGTIALAPSDGGTAFHVHLP